MVVIWRRKLSLDELRLVSIFNIISMDKNNKLNKRRTFLKNGIKVFGGSILLSPLLESCSKGMYNELTIDESLCIGCGDCNDVCHYGAIIMNGISKYEIIVSNCSICNWCVSVCDDKAITMPDNSYRINTSKCTNCSECLPSCNHNALKIAALRYTIKSGCVGCGDCIPVCKKEGEAIEYVVENYSVKSNCHGCVNKCSSVCSDKAISKVNGKAYIDTSKCTKCGKCYNRCNHNAITKAYVKLDQSKCTHCGKCYEVCTYKMIEKSGVNNIKESYIERLSCTNCGDCIDKCPEDAIYFKSNGDFAPLIDNVKCTACGNCFDICTEQKAIYRETGTALINQNYCMKCDKCFDVCNYDAVSLG